MLWAAVTGILPPPCLRDLQTTSVTVLMKKKVSCVCFCLWHSNALGACLHPSLGFCFSLQEKQLLNEISSIFYFSPQ